MVSIVNFLLLAYSLLVLLVIYIIDDIYLILIIFYCYSISIIYLNVKNSMSDPRVLLLGFFTLYSTFYPLQAYILEIGLLEIDTKLLVLSLKYQFLGIVTFVNIANFTIKNTYLDFASMIKNIYTNFLSEKIIFLILLPIVILSVLSIFNSGALSKREISDTGGI